MTAASQEVLNEVVSRFGLSNDWEHAYTIPNIKEGYLLYTYENKDGDRLAVKRYDDRTYYGLNGISLDGRIDSDCLVYEDES
jgi:hypothetical protein